MKTLAFLVLIMLSCMIRPSQAQQKPESLKGEIRGKVIDDSTKAPLDFASILVEVLNIQKGSVLTDENGDYLFTELVPDTYTVLVSYLGYNNMVIKNVIVTSGCISFQNISMVRSNTRELQDVLILSKKPLIDPDGVNKMTKTSKELKSLPQRNVNSIANTVAGVDVRYSRFPKVRGARSDGTAYHMDGVRMQSNQSSSLTQFPNNDAYASIKENQFKSTKSDPLSTFSIDVDRASYAIIRRHLNNNQLPPIDAVRVEELINYFPYQIEHVNSDHPFSIKTEVSNSPWDTSHKLVHITLKAPEIKMDQAPASNLVFLIDVSGSMQSPDKIELLKDCMRLLTKQLRTEDKVSIVVYAGAAGMVLEPTFGNHQTKILNAIDALSAGGSTAGGEGIKLAYSIARKHFINGGNNRIILATDGDFNVGITNINELARLIEKERESGVFLSVLGFGMGNLKDETMETLADKGNGNYNYIDQLLEGKKVLVNEIGGTLFTVAKDVKIQIEFNPNHVKSYRLIGYENRLLNNEDFNDDKKDAGEIGAGHCVTAIYEVIPFESEIAPKIDELKYQQSQLTEIGKSEELLTVKVRYKKPTDTKSVKFELAVSSSNTSFYNASNEMKFAVAVAMFGMKLRNSPFVKDISYSQLIQLGKSTKGSDEEGYRSEMIQLIEKAQLMASR